MEQQRLDAAAQPTHVKVHAQYLKDLSFENPNAPHSLQPLKAQPHMDVNIVLDANKITDPANDGLYESAITMTVKSTAEDTVLFITEITYAALVSFGKEVPEEHIKPILYIEVPQMIFPFVRQLVANASIAGGFPPVLLNPVDFRAMYADAVTRQADAAETPVAQNGAAAH
ncbi:MAG: protein-export chaperone SecB [Micavibrio sp.]